MTGPGRQRDRALQSAVRIEHLLRRVHWQHDRFGVMEKGLDGTVRIRPDRERQAASGERKARGHEFASRSANTTPTPTER
jgi:hypothetical protein